MRLTVDALNAELDAAGTGLTHNAEVLRGVLAGCGDCIKILDIDGRLQFMSEGGKVVMEVDDFSQLKGCPWPDFWAGEGNAKAHEAIKAARAGRVARFTGAANTARGTPRYWDVQVSPINGADGQPAYILSISRDITEQHRANLELSEALERQSVLSEELQHRIKNTLAIVGAIANQTMRGSDIDAARTAFGARLQTLASAHDILTLKSWASASIKDAVEGALAAHRTGENRIDVGGPHIELHPKQALSIALAVHELATNATKYGALSNASGKVSVSWAIENGEFSFTWRERAGPAVVEPGEQKRGFGSRLIERMLAGDFRGKVSIDYAPTGVVCELTCPASELAKTA